MFFTIEDITGVIVNSFVFCHKKAWLQARHISPSCDNSFLLMGKTLSEIRGSQKKMGNIEVDYLSKGSHIVVKEYKKTFSNVKAAKAQLLFYMMLMKKELECKKIEGFIISEEEDKKLHVPFSEENESDIILILDNILHIVNDIKPPVSPNEKICEFCAHNLYCK